MTEEGTVLMDKHEVKSGQLFCLNFDVLLTVHLSIFISVINQTSCTNFFGVLVLDYLFCLFCATNFDVLLTVHLSIFFSVINQIDAQSFVHQFG